VLTAEQARLFEEPNFATVATANPDGSANSAGASAATSPDAGVNGRVSTSDR